MKIIIVDDEKSILKLYKIILKNVACISSIKTFSSASAAIEYLNTEIDYDLVITDYCIPPGTFNGVDIAKAAQTNKATPVLLVSGSVCIDKHPDINLFDCLLMKPFSSKEIIKLIKYYA